MSNDIHIASFVVNTKPAAFQYCHKVLLQRLEWEIAASDAANSKFILVIETSSYQQLNELIKELNQSEGVLTVNMVFHQVERDDFLTQELVACQ